MNSAQQELVRSCIERLKQEAARWPGTQVEREIGHALEILQGMAPDDDVSRRDPRTVGGAWRRIDAAVNTHLVEVRDQSEVVRSVIEDLFRLPEVR
jgi:hypothetical protein